ncbi:Uncharacterised protein [Flavonifractor plautii]|uniref:Uncharacterized protein n=1 Tax=Flavonifractor plautii TaxID=292800 RepID=A0A174U5Z3_FLAPL|nr:Uncharacterised protein [Flavonifractor plautii]
MDSRSGPAVATTKSPANWERAESTSRAFSLRAVSPVMITAPVSTCSGAKPDFRYSSATMVRTPSASITVSESRGVK